jgi:hypothetical protein
MDTIQPRINFGSKIAPLTGCGILIFISTLIIITNTTSFHDNLSLVEIFIIIGIILLASLLFVALSLLFIGRAMITLTNNDITQWGFPRSISIPWEDVQEFDSLLGIRIIKSSNKTIQIYLEDFQDPDKFLSEVEARIPSTARYTQ